MNLPLSDRLSRSKSPATPEQGSGPHGYLSLAEHDEKSRLAHRRAMDDHRRGPHEMLGARHLRLPNLDAWHMAAAPSRPRGIIDSAHDRDVDRIPGDDRRDAQHPGLGPGLDRQNRGPRLSPPAGSVSVRPCAANWPERCGKLPKQAIVPPITDKETS